MDEQFKLEGHFSDYYHYFAVVPIAHHRENKDLDSVLVFTVFCKMEQVENKVSFEIKLSLICSQVAQ